MIYNITILLQERTKSVSLQAELDNIRTGHYKETKKLKRNFEEQAKEQQMIHLVMFRKFAQAFEEERARLESINVSTQKLLEQSKLDAKVLTERNKVLESQLMEAIMWEPRR